MSEMIERVARAIYSGAYPKHKFENDSQRIRDHYREVARAAMEAMREPTAEMLCAAVPYPLHLVIERADAKYTGAMEAATMADRITARQTYYDLIDAALAPHPRSP